MLSCLKCLTSASVVAGAKLVPISSQRNYKVAVIGASGGIGQPLSLLLKMNKLVTHLALYDVAKVTPGVAVDLSHINTPCRVTGHTGSGGLGDAIRCSSVVVIPAGVPRKPGMSRDDLFNTNASIIRQISNSVAENSPLAIMAIITNPVNSTVPIAAEVLKQRGVFDPRRVMGVTTLDIVRACTFVGEASCMDPSRISLPVIGGHSGTTIIPLFSHCNPPLNMCTLDINKLTEMVQDAGTVVVKAKAGGGSATLSMAFAAARFTTSILKGLSGESNVVECAYVYSGMCEPAYFANPVLLGQCGIEKNLCFCQLSQFEMEVLRKAMPELLKNIKTGQDFVWKSK